MVLLSAFEFSFIVTCESLLEQSFYKQMATHHSMMAASARGGNWICSNISSSEPQIFHLAGAHRQKEKIKARFSKSSQTAFWINTGKLGDSNCKPWAAWRMVAWTGSPRAAGSSRGRFHPQTRCLVAPGSQIATRRCPPTQAHTS